MASNLPLQSLSVKEDKGINYFSEDTVMIKLINVQGMLRTMTGQSRQSVTLILISSFLCLSKKKGSIRTANSHYNVIQNTKETR